MCWSLLLLLQERGGMALTGHALQNMRVLSCRRRLLSPVVGLVNIRHNTPAAVFIPLAIADRPLVLSPPRQPRPARSLPDPGAWPPGAAPAAAARARCRASAPAPAQSRGRCSRAGTATAEPPGSARHARVCAVPPAAPPAHRRARRRGPPAAPWAAGSAGASSLSMVLRAMALS